MFSVGDRVIEGDREGTIVEIHSKGTVDVLFDGSDYAIRRQDYQVEVIEPAYLPNPYRSNGEVVPFKKKKGLSRKQRASLPNDDFCILHTDKKGRTKRSFPINDYYHGRLALVYSMWPNNAHNRQKVKRCVFARYPELIDWWNNTEWVQDHPGEEYYGEELRRVANPHHMHIHWKHVNGGGPYRNLGAMRLNPRKNRNSWLYDDEDDSY
jgi:hypothetical protein